MGQSLQAAQPPQFSASDLISPDSLPGWMRQGPEAAQGGGWPPASPPRAPQPPITPQGPSAAGWGAPPAPWQSAPLESLQTMRHPIAGQPGAGAVSQAAPQEYPPAEWRQEPRIPPAQPPYEQRYAPPPVTPAPPPAPAYPGYPSGAQYAQPGYPNGAQYAQPEYPSGAQYAQQPGNGPYPQGAYPQPVTPQPAPAQPGFTPPNAFPPVEQAGLYTAPPPQAPGMGGYGLVDQTALPPWLAGSAQPGQPQGQSHGMQARSLVDEQALPEWLRQHPDERPRPSVAGWLGASATEEPLPAWMSSATPDTASGFGQPGAAQIGGSPLGGYPPQAPNGYPPQAPNGYPPQAPANGYMPQAPAPGAWQPPVYGQAAPPGSEELALPDWLQAQAGADGAMQPAQEASPSPYPQPQWGEEPAFGEAAQAGPDMRSDDVGAGQRAPGASPWDNGPLASDPETGEMREDQGWDTSAGWDDGRAGVSSDNRGERDGRGAPRKAPLAPDEMPPWLRRGAEFGAHARPGGSERRDPAGWGDEQEWDDGAGDWDDPRDGYDTRDNNGWGREYGGNPGQNPRNPRDEWGGAPSPGYGASADPYTNQRGGYDARGPRDPYARDDYADYNGGVGFYNEPDDADDGASRKRKGWRGFFRRGE